MRPQKGGVAVNDARPTMNYASPVRRPRDRSGTFTLVIGFAAAMLLLLLFGGLLPGELLILAFILIVFGLGSGIVAVIDKSPGGRMGLALVACEFVGLIAFIAYVFANFPVC
jgi:uncharacterized membrane protein YccC